MFKAETAELIAVEIEGGKAAEAGQVDTLKLIV